MPGNIVGDLLLWLQSLDLDQWSFQLFRLSLFVIFVGSLIRLLIIHFRKDR